LISLFVSTIPNVVSANQILIFLDQSDAGIYAVFIAGESFFMLVAYFINVVHNIKASRALHRGLLAKIIRAPTAFYDITPLGR
jgi:hypothetical protein